MPSILSANTLSSGYEVGNSLRLDNNAYMQSANTNSTNNPWTFSVWIKRAKIGAEQTLIMSYTDSNDFGLIRFGGGDDLLVGDYVNGSYVMKYETNRKFRDVGAWYHIVVSQSAVSGASPETKIYVNGVQETSFGVSNAYSQNDTQNWQKDGENFNFMMGQGEHYQQAYVCEAVWIDNTVYAASDFGEFDEDSGIWKPKDVSGLNFGTNGFYFDFADSGNLGDNEAGNSRADFSENNIAATDQSTDTCTNNFATLNILDPVQSDATYSEGNLKWATTTNGHFFWGRSTIGVSTGKWYAEFKATSIAEHSYVGIVNNGPEDNTTVIAGGGGAATTTGAYEWAYKTSDGQIYNTDGGSSYGNTYGDGAIIGVLLNLDDNEISFSKDGTVQNSGTAVSITAAASTPHGFYFFAVADGTSGTSATFEANFGSPPYAISSGNADANGHGNFEYAVPSGYLALCTKNLAENG